MKYILIIIMIHLGYSQCDYNGDYQLNILDIVEQIDCILNNCWETEYENADNY